MKRGQGKKKGNAYEITICRMLSKWFSGQADPPLFWRSASSGAQATMAKKLGKTSTHPGDIKAATEETMWVTDRCYLECKNYSSFTLDSYLVDNKHCLIRDWWTKCRKEAQEENKIPILVFKRNQFPDYIIVGDELIAKLITYIGKFGLKNIRFAVEPEGNERFTMMLLQEFLDWCSPETLKLCLENEYV